jgi:hypothetical protein
MPSFEVTSGAVAVATTSVKTVLEGLASSSKPMKIQGFSLTIGTAQTGEVKVETYTYTTTGTGTGKTPAKVGQDTTTALASVWKAADTAEPSGTVTVLDTYQIQCGAGVTDAWALNDELYIPESVGWGIRVTMPASTSTNVSVNARFKE